MTVKTCPDCGAPIGDDMRPSTMGCWYWGQAAERQRVLGWSPEQIASWRSCGADPPCEGNAYDVSQSDRRRSFWRQSVLAMAIIVAIVAGIAWLTH